MVVSSILASGLRVVGGGVGWKNEVARRSCFETLRDGQSRPRHSTRDLAYQSIP